jgi:hypothetical protein
VFNIWRWPKYETTLPTYARTSTGAYSLRSRKSEQTFLKQAVTMMALEILILTIQAMIYNVTMRRVRATGEKQ